MDETTIELGIISTTPTEAGTSVVGHGTGLTGTPGFRKLTEEEVRECVHLSYLFDAGGGTDCFLPFPRTATCSCRDEICQAKLPSCESRSEASEERKRSLLARSSCELYLPEVLRAERECTLAAQSGRVTFRWFRLSSSPSSPLPSLPRSHLSLGPVPSPAQTSHLQNPPSALGSSPHVRRRRQIAHQTKLSSRRSPPWRLLRVRTTLRRPLPAWKDRSM